MMSTMRQFHVSLSELLKQDWFLVRDLLPPMLNNTLFNHLTNQQAPQVVQNGFVLKPTLHEPKKTRDRRLKWPSRPPPWWKSSHQGACHLPASPSLGNPQQATCAAIILSQFQILLDYHLKKMFPKTNYTNSGNVKGKEIQKSWSEELKKYQRKIQSLRLNLNITQSNVKDIYKISRI